MLTHVDVYPFCSQMNIETLRENLYFQSKETLSAMLDALLERTEDFTDCAYTSHEHRERILELSAQARMELQQLISVWIEAVRALFHQSKSSVIAFPWSPESCGRRRHHQECECGPEWAKGVVPFLPPTWPEHPSHQHSQYSTFLGLLFLILASLDSVPPSPSLVHPAVPTLPPDSPLENSSPKCFFRVKSRGSTKPRGSWDPSLTAGAVQMCTVLNSEDS